MTFVNDHMCPLDLTQQALFFNDVFISSEQDLERTHLELASQLFANIGGTLIYQGRNGWCPFVEFICPVSEC